MVVLLVPLVFLRRYYGEWSSVVGSFEIPKIALLRTLVSLMVLWVAEWGLRDRRTFGLGAGQQSASFPPGILRRLPGRRLGSSSLRSWDDGAGAAVSEPRKPR